MLSSGQALSGLPLNSNVGINSQTNTFGLVNWPLCYSLFAFFLPVDICHVTVYT